MYIIKRILVICLMIPVLTISSIGYAIVTHDTYCFSKSIITIPEEKILATTDKPIIQLNHSATIFGPLPVPDSYINNVKPIIGVYYTPDVPGEAIDLTSAKLFLDGVLETDAQASDTGIVMQPISPLTIGKHTIIVSVSIFEGETNSLTWNFTIDLTLPELIINVPAKNITYTNIENYTISGTTKKTGDVNITINDVLVNIDSNGYFSKTITLTNNSYAGKNEICIKAISRAGNIRYINRTIIRDDIIPEFESINFNSVNTSQNVSYTNQPIVTINGRINLIKEYKNVWDVLFSSIIILNWKRETKMQYTANGYFNGDINLSAGMNIITIEAIDNAGNVCNVTKTIVYDIESPTIMITSPSFSRANAYEITGIVTDKWKIDSVYVNGKEVQIDNNGMFSVSVTITIKDGNNKIYIVATDFAGNSRLITFNVYFDTATIPNIFIAGMCITMIALVIILLLRQKPKKR